MKKFTSLSLLILLLSSATRAATFYWVGGTGSWSDFANHWATTSGGNVFQSGIPTINDDIVIDANSFTAPGQKLLFDSTFYFCHNMTWAGVTNHPEFSGNGGALNLYGSLVLDTGMDVTYLELKLPSNSGVNVLSTFGKTFSGVTQTGTATYQLGSDLSSGNQIDIEYGTLDCNGYDLSCYSFTKAGTAAMDAGQSTLFIHGLPTDLYARQININGNILNSSQFVIKSDAPLVDLTAVNCFSAIDSVIFTSGAVRGITANYVYSGNNAIIQSVNATDGVFPGSSYVVSGNFVNFSGKDVYLQQSVTLSVSGSFQMLGDCNSFGSLIGGGIGSGASATLNVTSSNVHISYVKIYGINATGSATFLADNSFDAGNNTGWTITGVTPRNMYWVGGSGDWSDVNHWSLTSGGAPTVCIPNEADNVFFDALSFSGSATVNFGTSASAGDVTISGLTAVPSFSGDNFYVYGNFDVLSPILWPNTTLHLNSPNTGMHFTTSGNSFNWVEVVGGGEYTITDSTRINTLVSSIGVLNLGGHAIQVGVLSSNPNAEVNMTNATIYAGGIMVRGLQTGSTSTTLIFDQNNGTLYNSGDYDKIYWPIGGSCDTNVTANLVVADQSFLMTHGNYFKSFYVTGDLETHGDNQADSLFLQNPGSTVTLNAGSAFTVNAHMQVDANCNGMVTIQSSSASSSSSIVKNSGNVSVSYVSLSGIAASGGANFTATNSIDAGGNSGWTITGSSPRTLYWVGGSGNWSDPLHWSLSSGGTGGECLPTLNDDIIFDASSGVASGTVAVDNSNASCKSIDFTNAGNDIQINGSSLTVYGAITLAPAMNWGLTNLTLRAAGSQNVVFHVAGNTVLNLVFDGSGTVLIDDDLIAQDIQLLSGGFNAQNHDIKSSRIISSVGTTIELGPLTLTITHLQLDGTVINSKSTDVIMDVFAPGYYSFGNTFRTGGTFHNITALMPNASFWSVPFKCNQLIAYGLTQITANGVNPDTIGKAIFFDYTTMGGAFVIDTLFFNNPGQITNLQGNIQVNNLLLSNGTAAFPCYLKGSSFLNFTVNGNDVCLSNALLENMQMFGTAQCFAGNGCVDLGGNTGWQFTPCTVTSDVWPGDANYDLNCDNLDILNIGVAMNETGPVRSGASTSWTAQPVQDFTHYFNTGVNMKHADCDGNGVVDLSDTIAVSQNYGLNHPARYAGPVNTTDAVNAPPLYLEAFPDTVLPSGSVHVDIQMGTNQLPVDSMYGIAFSLEYDPTLIDTNSIVMDWTGSWLGTLGSDMIAFVRHFPTIGRIDVALTRTDHNNVGNGIGHLGMFDVVVVDNISTVTDALFRLTNVNAITYSQMVLPVARQNDTVTIDPNYNAIAEADLTSHFLLYPNPASTELNVYSHDLQIRSISIFDAAGREVYFRRTENSHTNISLSSLSTGMYHLRCITDKGVYNTGISVIH